MSQQIKVFVMPAWPLEFNLRNPCKGGGKERLDFTKLFSDFYMYAMARASHTHLMPTHNKSNTFKKETWGSHSWGALSRWQTLLVNSAVGQWTAELGSL